MKGLKRLRTLALTDSYSKVNQFLNSKSRNSPRTKIVYGFALSHFQTFLNTDYKDYGYNVETVLIGLEEKKINVYSILDDFINYLTLRQDPNNGNTKLSNQTIVLYVAGVRSYLEYWDIDISQNKFKKKVTLPKIYKRNKEALDAEEIRTILQNCTNVRLKVFLLVLASSGMRSIEAITLRNSDINFNSNPTGVHIRAEFSKTKRSHDIYISDEASKELKKFIDSNYSNIDEYKKYPEHLIFNVIFKDKLAIKYVYGNLNLHFTRTLKKIGMDKRKEGQGTQRRAISFHSFRAYVYSTVNDQTSSRFAEWVLNHEGSGSEYYGRKQEERRQLYLKCEPYLTFLSYETVKSVGKDYLSKLQERDHEIEQLREELYKTIDDSAYANMEIDQMKRYIEELRKQVKIKKG